MVYQYGHRKSGLFRFGGFTFVEMLAVLFIVGLIISLVAIRVNDDPETDLLNEAKRFSALVALVGEESIVSGRAYGVDIDSIQNSYRFLIYKRGWKVIEQSNNPGEPLRERYLSESVGLKVLQSELISFSSKGSDSEYVFENDDESFAPEPEIIVTPVGAVSDFEIVFLSGKFRILVKPGLDQDFKIVKLEKN